MYILNRFFSLIMIFSLLFLSACNGSGEKNSKQVSTNPASRTEFLMGTVVTVKIYDKDKDEIVDLAFNRIENLARRITTEETASEISQINQNAGIRPVQVSKDIFTLTAAGKKYSELSDGSFDVTIGALSNLWRIGFPDARKPSQQEIDEVLPLIDYKKIKLNEDKQTVFLEKENMQIDLGGIAKGFITDEVVTLLKDNDVTSAVVDLGGNIYVLGKNAKGKKWTVGIQDPFSPRGEIIGSIQLTNKSVVTSGIYERYLEAKGEVYHHILNPEDGYPFDNEIAGVSVITEKSVDGDALSTLLFSKGIEDGLAFAEKLDGVEAVFVSKDNEVYLTEGLKGTFTLTNKNFQIKN